MLLEGDFLEAFHPLSQIVALPNQNVHLILHVGDDLEVLILLLVHHRLEFARNLA